MRLLLSSLGRYSGLYRFERSNDVIEGRKVTVRPRWEMRWKAHPKHLYGVVDDRYAWTRVRLIAPGRRSVEVFNLTVEEDESYIAEGIVVHNCADRSRVLRLAGTVNHKTGRYARLLWFDLALPGYDVGALVGDLPDMRDGKAGGRKVARPVDHDDPYKRIAPAEYFRVLAGIEVPHSGFVRCPSPQHDDRTPSCMVGDDAEAGFYCYGCGDGGAIYDLASLLEGGPTGSALRGEAFRAARRRVREAFGDLT
jgi:hypothetical protein